MCEQSDIDNFVCPDCGRTECELEQDILEDGFLLAEDLVCDYCGGFIRLV